MKSAHVNNFTCLPFSKYSRRHIK